MAKRAKKSSSLKKKSFTKTTKRAVKVSSRKLSLSRLQANRRRNRPVSARLLITSLIVACIVAYAWFINIPSPEAAYQQFLKQTLTKHSIHDVTGANDQAEFEVNGQWLVDLKKNQYRTQSEMVCQFDQNGGNQASAILSSQTDKGKQYVRIKSIDGSVSLGGETVYLADKYKPVTGQWFYYETDDLTHFTESQTDNNVVLGLSWLVAPDVDQGIALQAIKDNKVFEIVSSKSHNRFRQLIYTLKIRAHREAYIKMLEAAVPLLSNRSELVSSIFGDKSQIDSELSLQAVDASKLYETLSLANPCSLIGAKLFGDRVAGKANTISVTSAPIVSNDDLAPPINALPFTDYFKALGLNL